MQRSWLGSLTAGAQPEELPLLPVIRPLLAGLLEDDLAPLRRIARALMHDPALALRVLRRANAIPHRYFSFELASLEDAIHMLGTRTLARMLAQAAGVDAALEGERGRFYRQGAGRAVLSALLAQDWAEIDRDRFPDQVSLGALLSNLGELFLLAHGDDRMRRYLEMVERFHVYPQEAEYVTLSDNLEALGYQLALRWGLPELVRESMQSRNALHARTLCVMLATQTARYALAGWRHPLQGQDLRLIAQALDLDVFTLRARINRTLGDFNSVAGHYALDPVPLLPIETGEETSLAQISPCAPHFCLAPRADDYSFARSALRDGISEPDVLFRTLLRGLHRGLGLNRVLVALYDPEARRLSAEYLAGTDFELGFNRFLLPVTDEGLFDCVCKAGGGLWVGEGGSAELASGPWGPIRERTGSDRFFVAALETSGQVTRLLYADRRCPGCALDAISFARFLELAELTQRCLHQTWH